MKDPQQALPLFAWMQGLCDFDLAEGLCLGLPTSFRGAVPSQDLLSMDQALPMEKHKDCGASFGNL